MKSKSRRGWRQGLRAGLAFGSIAAFVFACPLYSDCDDSGDCAAGWRCDPFSRRCERVEVSAACTVPADCLAGETCAPDGVCRPGSCAYHGCVSGYRCGVVDGTHTCVPDAADAGPDAAPVVPDSGGTSTPEPVDASSEAPADASGLDASPTDSGAGDADAN